MPINVIDPSNVNGSALADPLVTQPTDTLLANISGDGSQVSDIGQLGASQADDTPESGPHLAAAIALPGSLIAPSAAAPIANNTGDNSTAAPTTTKTDGSDTNGTVSLLSFEAPAPLAAASSSDTITALTNLQSDADSLLGDIEAGLKVAIDLEQMPLIGQSLKDSFDATRELHAVEALQQAIDTAISATQTFLQGDPTGDAVAKLTETLSDQLAAAGIAAGHALKPFTVSLTDTGLTLGFTASKTIDKSISLDDNLGFKGLSLKTTGSADASLGYNFNFTLGDDFSDITNPYVLTNGNPVVSLDGMASVPGLQANATLGFLPIVATDQGSALNANIGLSLIDPNFDGKVTLAELQAEAANPLTTQLTGDANVNVHFATNLQNANLPSISADLVGNWAFGGSNPTLSFQNVQYDLGSFIDNFVEPVLSFIRPVLGPLEDIITLLNTNITPLQLIPGAEKVLDKAGKDDGYGNDAPDGKITLLDFVKVADPSLNLLPAENFIKVVSQIDSWAQILLGQNFGVQSYDMGSFSLPFLNDTFQSAPQIISGAANLSNALSLLSAGSSAATGKALTDALSNPSLSFSLLTDPNSAFNFLLGKDVNLFTATLPQFALNFGPGFDADGNPAGPPIDLLSIPVLGIPNVSVKLQGDFSAAMNLAFGFDTTGLHQFLKDGDSSDIINGLYVTDMINGSVQPFVSLTGLIQLAAEANFAIASITGGGNVEGNIDFGLNEALGNGDHKLYFDQIKDALATNPFKLFDTSGKFTAGFNAYIKALNLFTVWQYNSPRVTLGEFSPASRGSGNGSTPKGPPPLGISDATIAATSDAGQMLTITGGTPSDKGATLTYEWQRSTDGNAFVDIGGATGATYTVTRADIGSELQVIVTASETGQNPISTQSTTDVPNLAMLNGSELDVLMPDGDQIYTIAADQGGVAVQAFGRSQHFDGVSTIVVTAGDGDNSVTIAPDVPVPATINYTGNGTENFTAGVGDTINGGNGVNYLDGTAGKDALIGGTGTNFFEGGPGDQIVGGAGANNILSFQKSPAAVTIDASGPIGFASGGNAQGLAFTNITEFDGSNFGDTFTAAPGGSIFHGGTGNDVITGGPGNDILEGGGGSDKLSGGGGANIFVFDPGALTSAQAATPAFETITGLGAGDKLDVSELVINGITNGAAANKLVRVIEDAGGSFAKLQVNAGGTATQAAWTTIAHLDGVQGGAPITAIVDPTHPEGVAVPVLSESFLLSTTPFLGGADNNELWSIGDKRGPEHLFDTINPNGSASISNFFNLGDQVYFTADDGTHGNELWVSNGTTTGTHLVADINPNGDSQTNFNQSASFMEYNGKLVFQADDGAGDGNQLWITDGTADGTVKLTDIPSGGARFESFTQIDGKLYFVGEEEFASDPILIHPRLFETDGTTVGTSILINLADWSVGTAFSSISAPIKSPSGGLYVEIGTGGTQLDNFYPVAPGQPLGVGQGVFPFNGLSAIPTGAPPVYLGQTPILPFLDNLWTVSGRSAHGILSPDPSAFAANRPFVTNITDVTLDEPLGLVFAVGTDFSNTGNELYATDGTLTGSHLVADINPGTADSNPHGLTVADDGTLYFAANDGVNGDALWKSDGTAGGTTLVKVINPNFKPQLVFEPNINLMGFGSASDAFYQVHGRIYFTVEDDGGTTLGALWTSDGTTAGTYSLGVQLTGPTSAGSVATDGDNLFFNSGEQLWETDGTVAGTHQVTSGTTHTGTTAFALYLGLAPTPEVSKPPSESPIVLDNFGWAQGWGSPNNPRVTADVDGNGTTDYVGFGADSVFINYGGTFANGQGTGPGFTDATFAVHDFGTAEGYTTSVQRGVATTQAGSGATIYGQGFSGVFWYGVTGGTQQTDAAGKEYSTLQYGSTPNLYGNFGSQQGWTPANGFQIVTAQPNNSFASILGFGADGIVVGPQAFAPGATAASSYVIPFQAGNSFGWSQQVDIRTFTDANGKTIDLNHDGTADFVGMGPQGLSFAFGNSSGPNGQYGLNSLQSARISGNNPDLGEAQGWTDATTLRYVVADPNTGFYDILAFGAPGVFVSMGQDPSTHQGQPFGQLYLAMPDFGSDQGWSVSQTPRIVGDVNGDGVPDIVGFGANSTFAAIGSLDAQGQLHFMLDSARTINDFGYNEAWSGTDPQTVRTLGDVAGNGHSDLILSGAFNTQIWQFS